MYISLLNKYYNNGGDNKIINNNKYNLKCINNNK